MAVTSTSFGAIPKATLITSETISRPITPLTSASNLSEPIYIAPTTMHSHEFQPETPSTAFDLNIKPIDIIEFPVDKRVDQGNLNLPVDKKPQAEKTNTFGGKLLDDFRIKCRKRNSQITGLGQLLMVLVTAIVIIYLILEITTIEYDRDKITSTFATGMKIIIKIGTLIGILIKDQIIIKIKIKSQAIIEINIKIKIVIMKSIIRTITVKINRRPRQSNN